MPQKYVIPNGALGEPQFPVARQLCMALLDEAISAVDDYGACESSETVHDLRVAVRRLRSNLRSYRALFSKRKIKGTRTRLRGFMLASATAREADVELEWLNRTIDIKTGELSELFEAIRWRRDAGYDNTRRAIQDRFPRVANKLRAFLSSATERNGGGSYRLLVATLIADHAADLGKKIATIRVPSDVRTIHSTRISGKRLRYLMEPLRDVECIGLCLEGVKKLQDLLGNLHDLHVISVDLTNVLQRQESQRDRNVNRMVQVMTDPGLGISAPVAIHVRIARQIKREQLQIFEDLELDWLHGGSDAFLEEVISIADRVGSGELG